MPLDTDTKDEIRYLIAKEAKSIIEAAFNAALNMPINPSEFAYANSAEGRQEREKRKKLIGEIKASVMASVDANLREAKARIVEKTDPEKAEVIRKLVPSF